MKTISMKIFAPTPLLFLLVMLSLLLNVSDAKAQAPTAPINLTAISETSNRIRLSWQDQSSNETYFIIERAQDTDDNFVSVDSVGTDTTEYIDIDLTAETTYFYRVKATNMDGESAYSNTIGASTVPITNISDEKLQALIRVYPVPTRDYLRVDISHQQSLPYTLVNLHGKVLQKGKLNNSFSLNMRNLPKGIYFLVIQIDELLVVRKVLKS
ncbi:hypothetical protein BKI52_37220 [marine bacterium AO1-C]|nr:hypothetical protein BKI52_37220 [marine bacterium AO1-C]